MLVVLAKLASAAAVAGLVVVGVPVAMYLAQDQLLFQRRPVPEFRRAEIARRFPSVQELNLSAADGTRLHAWHVTASQGTAAPLVIYFGGNAEEVSWMLEAVGDPRAGSTPGVAWLLVDYRGYGASEGEPSEGALFADSVVLYDAAAKLPGVDPARIFGFGRSLGSGVVVHLAAERPLAGAILVTPYDSMVSVAKRHYPLLPVDWMLQHRFESILVAPRLRVPLLCVVAERDQVIPPEHAARLFAAWGGPKTSVILEGATHNDTDGRPAYWPAIRRFLERPGV